MEKPNTRAKTAQCSGKTAAGLKHMGDSGWEHMWIIHRSVWQDVFRVRSLSIHCASLKSQWKQFGAGGLIKSHIKMGSVKGGQGRMRFSALTFALMSDLFNVLWAPVNQFCNVPTTGCRHSSGGSLQKRRWFRMCPSVNTYLTSASTVSSGLFSCRKEMSSHTHTQYRRLTSPPAASCDAVCPRAILW